MKYFVDFRTSEWEFLMVNIQYIYVYCAFGIDAHLLLEDHF